MSVIILDYYIILVLVLFIIGVIGVMMCRNVLVLFMSVELMFNVVNFIFLMFVCVYGDNEGYIMVFFIIVVVVVEVVVGLVIIFSVFCYKWFVNVDEVVAMKC